MTLRMEQPLCATALEHFCWALTPDSGRPNVSGTRLEGGVMAYAITCADLGAPCPGQFTTESEGELMQHVTLHVEQAHPDMQLTPEVLESAKSMVRQV